MIVRLADGLDVSCRQVPTVDSLEPDNSAGGYSYRPFIQSAGLVQCLLLYNFTASNPSNQVCSTRFKSQHSEIFLRSTIPVARTLQLSSEYTASRRRYTIYC